MRRALVAPVSAVERRHRIEHEVQRRTMTRDDECHPLREQLELHQRAPEGTALATVVRGLEQRALYQAPR